MILVLVSGRAQSGKDTFFRLFKEVVAQENPDARVERFAFADELKRIAADNGWMGGKSGEGRSFLIDCGQILRGDYELRGDHIISRYNGDIVCRHTYDLYLLYRLLTLEYEPHPNFWVERCAEKIREQQPDVAVITDWRFPNEGLELPQLLGIPRTRVARLRIHRPCGAEVINDPSETSLNDFCFDHIIDNSGGLDALRIEIKRWFDNA